ncbi:Excinuclease UvrABC ATPase subunit [Pseudomonas syringae pv. actinidiae]|uniref:Excinuclease UvrABC ATPase subunit n=1 Tax=Pseudomonas syringae pv. actinidiae TaxID=103796 RepID=A0A2V0QP10_PSESF|nr:Excinuclease UvrABC ATPase subunit [Pseudomonas syringae pv. actinidiae]
MIGRGRIDARTTGKNSAEVLSGYARAGEYLQQLRAIASIHSIAQGIEVTAKTVQRAQDRLTIGHEDVVPHGRIAARDTREVTKAASGIAEYFQVFVTFGQ